MRGVLMKSEEQIQKMLDEIKDSLIDTNEATTPQAQGFARALRWALSDEVDDTNESNE